MSFIMMAKAMKIKTGSPARKLVLLKLADDVNDMAQAFGQRLSPETARSWHKRSGKGSRLKRRGPWRVFPLLSVHRGTMRDEQESDD